MTAIVSGSTCGVGCAANYEERNHIVSYMKHQRMGGSIKSIRGRRANHVNALLIITQTREIIFSGRRRRDNEILTRAFGNDSVF